MFVDVPEFSKDGLIAFDFEQRTGLDGIRLRLILYLEKDKRKIKRR